MDRLYFGGLTIPIREITLIEWAYKNNGVRIWTRGGMQDNAHRMDYSDISACKETQASLYENFEKEMNLLIKQKVVVYYA